MAHCCVEECVGLHKLPNLSCPPPISGQHGKARLAAATGHQGFEIGEVALQGTLATGLRSKVQRFARLNSWRPTTSVTCSLSFGAENSLHVQG